MDALRIQRQKWEEVGRRALELRQSTNVDLDSVNRIVLFGEGSSEVAAGVAKKLLSLNVEIRMGASCELAQSIEPRSTDLCFAISHRGGTQTTKELAHRFLKANASVFYVASADAAITLGHHLKTVSLEKVEPHTVSLTSAICAIHVFLEGQSALEFWKELSKEPDRALSDLSAPQLILGQGPGFLLAKEALIKLSEMANVCPLVFDSESYFHGPRFVKVNGPVWYFEDESDPRRSEILEGFKPEIFNLGKSKKELMQTLISVHHACHEVAVNSGRNPDEPPVGTV